MSKCAAVLLQVLAHDARDVLREALRDALRFLRGHARARILPRTHAWSDVSHSRARAAGSRAQMR